MLTSTLENVLNRGLPRSPRAQQLCAELSGRKVCVAISGFGHVVLESNGSTLKLSAPGGDEPADARLSGGPLSLLALAGPTPEAVLQRGDVRIEGDAELADKFRELARLLRPDPEEELALLTGDVPAHQIGRVARAALSWTLRAGRTTVRNLAEYLGHERGDVLSRGEAEPFLRGVDALREDVDRLAARVELALAARSPDGGANSPSARPTDRHDA